MKITVRETAIFGMLGTLMYCSKLIMEALPNIHLIGVLTVAFTVVYRRKALYPQKKCSRFYKSLRQFQYTYGWHL